MPRLLLGKAWSNGSARQTARSRAYRPGRPALACSAARIFQTRLLGSLLKIFYKIRHICMASCQGESFATCAGDKIIGCAGAMRQESIAALVWPACRNCRGQTGWAAHNLPLKPTPACSRQELCCSFHNSRLVQARVACINDGIQFDGCCMSNVQNQASPRANPTNVAFAEEPSHLGGLVRKDDNRHIADGERRRHAVRIFNLPNSSVEISIEGRFHDLSMFPRRILPGGIPSQ